MQGFPWILCGGQIKEANGKNRFSVHFNVHAPLQIAILNNWKLYVPFKNETLHYKGSWDR
jgi:hypothetical protein